MKFELPNPHPGQIAVMKQARRWNFLAAGRRWRKTTLFMSLAVQAALQGKKVVWGSPTFAQADIAWEEMKQAIPESWASYNVQRKQVKFPTGGIVYFRSLDRPETARGLTADIVLVDEAGFVMPVAWYEVLLPTLLDTGGTAWVGGTPNKRNWFYTEWAKAKDRKDSMSWSIPTLGVEILDHGTRLVRKPHPLENPEIKFEDIEAMFLSQAAETFRQEILAEFLENSGSVFAYLERSVTLPVGWADPAEHKNHSVLAGVDWGKLQDYTSISIGCQTCKKELDLFRVLGMDYAAQRELLKDLRTTWGIEMFLVEQNSIGEVQLEELINDDLPVYGFQTTTKSKGPMVEGLAYAIEKGHWKFIDHPAGTLELLSYERSTNPITGHSSYSAPVGQHDDTVISRGLMLELAGSGPLIL